MVKSTISEFNLRNGIPIWTHSNIKDRYCICIQVKLRTIVLTYDLTNFENIKYSTTT